MTARVYAGDEDQADAFEARETRQRLGAHHDGGTGSAASTVTFPPSTKPAEKITTGDTIIIGKITYLVDNITTDDSKVADRDGFVNLEVVRILQDGSHGTRSWKRFAWYEVLTMGVAR